MKTNVEVQKSKIRKVVESVAGSCGVTPELARTIGGDAGVPRAFDTFRNSKNLASAPFVNLLTEVSALRIWTRRGLQKAGTASEESQVTRGHSMFGVWGSPGRFLNRHLQIRDNSGAFGIRSLFNPLKNVLIYIVNVLIYIVNTNGNQYKSMQIIIITEILENISHFFNFLNEIFMDFQNFWCSVKRRCPLLIRIQYIFTKYASKQEFGGGSVFFPYWGQIQKLS